MPRHARILDDAPQVIVVGNLTIDDVVRADGTAAMGSLGGNAIYAATGAKIWGPTVGVVARVGDDFPPSALARLRAAGLDTSGMQSIEGPTLRLWILYEDDGRRSWVSRTSPERSVEVAPQPADLPPLWFAGPGVPVVHVAAMPLFAAARIVEQVRSLLPSATVTLDTYEECCTDREALLNVARQVDVFLPSREELHRLFGYDDPTRACTELISEGVPAVVAKCGERGALVATRAAGPISVGAAEVKVVDETGAGDSFCGGVAAGLALGDDLVAAAQRGAATAGAALGAIGSLRLLDGREALAKQLLAGYRQGVPTQANNARAEDAYDIGLMDREIATMPEVIRAQLGGPPPQLTAVVEELRRSGARHLVFVGCGDSAFVGQAAVLAFNRHTSLAVRAEHALDFARYSVRYQPKDTAVVAVSFSGQAGRTVEAAHQAKAFGHTVIGLTNAPDGPLAKIADYVLPVSVPTLGSSPGTSTYIGMLLKLLALAAELGVDDEGVQRDEAYAEQLATLPDLAGQTLALSARPSFAAAEQLVGARMVTFIGAGPNEASARFGAAKLFEGAQQLATTTNVEEWAHEQYFVTRPADPVVVVAPSGAASDRAQEILSELTFLGARIIFVGDAQPSEAVLHLPLAAAVPEELSPVLAALPLSQLGFHLAALNGKRSYNFPSDEAKKEHYDTIHRVTVGEPA